MIDMRWTGQVYINIYTILFVGKRSVYNVFSMGYLIRLTFSIVI